MRAYIGVNWCSSLCGSVEIYVQATRQLCWLSLEFLPKNVIKGSVNFLELLAAQYKYTHLVQDVYDGIIVCAATPVKKQLQYFNYRQKQTLRASLRSLHRLCGWTDGFRRPSALRLCDRLHLLCHTSCDRCLDEKHL